MTIEEIKQFLQENGDSEDVKGFLQSLQGEPKPLTMEDVNTFLTQNDEGKMFLQSYGDSRVTKGIESWKNNNLDKLIQAEMLKKNPNKTPEQLQIEELTKQFEEERQKRNLSEQKSKLKDELRDKNVDPRIVDLLINSDETVTKANIQLYLDANKNYIQKEVENRLKAGQYTPPNSETDAAKKAEAEVMKVFGL